MWQPAHRLPDHGAEQGLGLSRQIPAELSRDRQRSGEAVDVEAALELGTPLLIRRSDRSAF
jgi:hypothetical protein